MDSNIEALQAENARLRQQVAELENALRDRQRLLDGIVNNSPAVIYVKTPENRLLLVNRLYARVVQRDVEDLIGKTEDEIYPPEVVAAWRESDRQLFASGKPMQFENIFVIDGEQHDFLTMQFPLYDEEGAPYAICGVSTDITDLKRAERERETLQNEVIAAQQAVLREMSTPLIPLADDIVLMPLIGSLDSSRAQQVMETLLEGITEHVASIAILDITGLPVIDTQVANALLQATKAVRLLGSEVILTGISPRVAQTLIGIEADLSTIKTPGTLQSGIAYALEHRDEL
ncbi:MAG TPA: PAS domain-containing protein [Herpetosiphonaceae bacterium]